MEALRFSSVLVANRGEIAVRIIRTVKAMGLRSMVVYHEVDKDSPAVAMADVALPITGATPVAAYLDAEQIVRVATQAGAGAIHPGYGFLSENTAFAAAVEQAGMAFVGPTPAAIDLMGDKVRARAFVAKHGFPVAPSAIEDDDPATFVERARSVGFPLLIKPAAGGGGKGMRIVREPATLAPEIERARSEGQRYFGDGRLYVERYIEQPRHIEVQVLGDAHGNVIHVFERECSVQRRFQKIVEESPSPALTDELRLSICKTAAGIAKAANYQNAGTVEFIYGAGVFYFLEMNTRLQVEHPVTEAITGLDLVREQLRVASGLPLSVSQKDVKVQGHAIEFRLYAEDAASGFTPTTGPVHVLSLPTGEGVRVDAGIRQGQQVTSAFDPMLAKIIVSGKDREEVRRRADTALANSVLLGCKTNAGFLRRLLSHPAFIAGDIHTGFLDAHPEIAAEPVLDAAQLQAALATASLLTQPVMRDAQAIPAMHAAMGAWRN